MSQIIKDTHLPQGILVKAAKAVDPLVPEKTRRIYEKEYFHFEAWLQKHCVDHVDEIVLMASFQDLSESYSPNLLWTKFSMLRKEVIVHKKIRSNEKLISLQLFLKQIGKNYQPKKSKVLTREQVITFWKEAPTEKYLADKVALVIGVFGACRRDELVKMKFSDVRDMGQYYISIDIPESKNGQARSFLVIKESEMCGLKLIRDYISLRHKGASIDRFFLSYRDKRCTVQPIGLSVAKAYTGHSLRRTAATIHSGAGGSSESLMRLGGWKNSSVAPGYVDNSESSKLANASFVAGKSITSTAVEFGNVDFSGQIENCTFYFQK